jgi:RecJ-like exonuclease
MTRHTCPKCEGHGTIRAYSNVQGGVCFKCGGAGKVAAKPSSKSRKFVFIYAGQEVFARPAKSEAAALRMAVTHWQMNASLPAFSSVRSEADISVKPV